MNNFMCVSGVHTARLVRQPGAISGPLRNGPASAECRERCFTFEKTCAAGTVL